MPPSRWASPTRRPTCSAIRGSPRWASRTPASRSRGTSWHIRTSSRSSTSGWRPRSARRAAARHPSGTRAPSGGLSVALALQVRVPALPRPLPVGRHFATWNEANHCGEPTCHRPTLVGPTAEAITRECPSCTILAAELLDMPNMVSGRASSAATPRRDPRDWGLHNYVDANRFRTSGTRDCSGGEGRRLAHRGGRHRLPREQAGDGQEPGPAARVAGARREGDGAGSRPAVPISPRLTRVYIYAWNASTLRDSWDSALITPGGRGRPALRILQDRVKDGLIDVRGPPPDVTRLAIISDTHLPRGRGAAGPLRRAPARSRRDPPRRRREHRRRARGDPRAGPAGARGARQRRRAGRRRRAADSPRARARRRPHRDAPRQRPGGGAHGALRARFPEAGAVVFGHSHIPLHERDADGLQLFNPGSPTDRRRQPRHTMGLAEVRDGAVRFELVVLD